MRLGFPCGSAGKESTCNLGDLGLIPGLGRSPGEGKGYPLQYSGLEHSMDCIVHGVTKSRTQLSDFHFLPDEHPSSDLPTFLHRPYQHPGCWTLPAPYIQVPTETGHAFLLLTIRSLCCFVHYCIKLLHSHTSLNHTKCGLFDSKYVFWRAGGASGKEPTWQCRRHKRHGFAPWVRKMPWRRAWQPTPVFLPGEFHGQRILEGFSPQGHKDWSDFACRYTCFLELAGSSLAAGSVQGEVHSLPALGLSLDSFRPQSAWLAKRCKWCPVLDWLHLSFSEIFSIHFMLKMTLLCRNYSTFTLAMPPLCLWVNSINRSLIRVQKS